MQCIKCGKTINDGAAFCPYCGESTEGADVGTPDNKTQKSVKSHKKRNTIIAVSLIFVAAVVLFLVFRQPSWVKENSGRGAGSPQELAEAYLKVINGDDPKSMQRYWDAELEAKGKYLGTDKLKEESEYATSDGLYSLYLPGAEYSVGNVYTNANGGKSYDNVKVDIACRTEGMLGGESVFTGYDYTCSITLHKNVTPDGDRWFLGSMGGQWVIGE